jgi:hypothetical protein
MSSIFNCACSGVPSGVPTIGPWAPAVSALSAYGNTVPNAATSLAQVAGGGGRVQRVTDLMQPFQAINHVKIAPYSTAMWSKYDTFLVEPYVPDLLAVANPYVVQSNMVEGQGDMFYQHPSRSAAAAAAAAAAAGAMTGSTSAGLVPSSLGGGAASSSYTNFGGAASRASDIPLSELAAVGAAAGVTRPRDPTPFATVPGIAQTVSSGLQPGGGSGGGGWGGGGYGPDSGGYGPGPNYQVGPMTQFAVNECGCCKDPTSPLTPSGFSAWKNVIEEVNRPYQQFAPFCRGRCVGGFGLFRGL